MREYRLLKHYPSLPNTWKDQEPLIVVERRLGYELHPSLKGTVELGFLQFEEVENNEYWEEIKPKEKEYEILSYEGGIVPYISSVRRLSDKEVFNLGDTVKYRTSSFKPFTIEKFKIDDKEGDLRVIHGNKDAFLEYVDVLLKSIHKVKTPLFTTEDGKEIYKGDWFYYVDPDVFIVLSAKAYTNFKPYLSFSTEDLAQDYIDTYKPQYSLDTMVKVVNNWSMCGVDRDNVKKAVDKLLK